MPVSLRPASCAGVWFCQSGSERWSQHCCWCCSLVGLRRPSLSLLKSFIEIQQKFTHLKCTILVVQPPRSILKYSHLPQERNPLPLYLFSVPPSLPLPQALSNSVSVDFSFLDFHVNGSIEHVVSCDWFLSLTVMFLSFIKSLTVVPRFLWGLVAGPPSSTRIFGCSSPLYKMAWCLHPTDAHLPGY